MTMNRVNALNNEQPLVAGLKVRVLRPCQRAVVILALLEHALDKENHDRGRGRGGTLVDAAQQHDAHASEQNRKPKATQTSHSR